MMFFRNLNQNGQVNRFSKNVHLSLSKGMFFSGLIKLTKMDINLKRTHIIKHMTLFYQLRLTNVTNKLNLNNFARELAIEQH